MIHSPITLPDTALHRLESAIVGDTYRLLIALPDNYATAEATYPVIYVVDGNELTPLVRFVVRALNAERNFPRVIVVGIGYDTDDFVELWRVRERDFLPTNDPTYLKQRRRGRVTAVGQAARFLHFIRAELKPFIAANYRVQPDDCTYVGNSHGGLFGIYTLFQQPETFQRYVISSPSLHHDQRVVLAYERDYAAHHADLPAHVFLSVGGREETDDPLINARFQFVTNVQTLAQTLAARQYPGLRLTTYIFADETHASVVPAAVTRGLRAVFAPDELA